LTRRGHLSKYIVALLQEKRVKTAGDTILFQLKSLGQAQAETLARRLGISVQAVRQRLERLLNENLVLFSDRAQGRGRPRRFWSLAPGAASLFPDTHAQLTVDLIGTIRSELGESALAQLLERRREQITAAYRKRLAREPDIAKKLTALADMRSAEGYMARLETLPDGGLLLVEDHCPICAAAMSCQGFCSIELTIFRDLIGPGWHIERQDHVLTGARRCTYRITPAAATVSDSLAQESVLSLRGAKRRSNLKTLARRHAIASLRSQ
jgi:predicted ArsR family transcriptional regulator